MLEGQIGPLQIQQCERCHGIWLDTETFAQVCQDAGKQSAVLGASRTWEPAADCNPMRIRYRTCPRCTNHMNRLNFARCSGVVVDICGAHGTWFDRDELQRIVQFIHTGGLERSRAAEVEHLERERRRLLQAMEQDRQPPTISSRLTGPYGLEELILWGAVSAAGSLLKKLLRK